MANFIPRNLFEQYHKFGNVYFTLISVLMWLGDNTKLFIGTIKAFSTLYTLIAMMMVTAVMALLDDLKRGKADKEINEQLATIITDTESDQRRPNKKWLDVKVGDVLEVKEGEELPADIVLIKSSQSEGICFVSTANLDGETNLKRKDAIEKWQVSEGLAKLKGTKVSAEPPNENIYAFNGNLEEGGKKESIGADQLLLRGTMLRNTEWVVGVVVYTGEETRMVMNSRPAPLKQSNIERDINKVMLIVLVVQFFMALLSDLLFLYVKDEYRSYWYILPPDLILPDPIGYLISFFVLYSNLMPISLYPSMEFVNLAHAYFIRNDFLMLWRPHKAKPSQQGDCFAAAVRTSNLCQELGQVDYVFSDKTGTLTQNVMEFKCCSIAGEQFGDTSPASNKFDKGKAQLEKWRDGKPEEIVSQEDAFWEVLSVCHTVLANDTKEGKMYEAESPDEAALVSTAAEMGWAFQGRVGQTLEVERHGRSAKYVLKAQIAFDSTRKRMSVLVQHDKKYILLVKGADNVMLERSAKPQKLLEKHLMDFSLQGLRTLVIGRKELDESAAKAWLQKYEEAQGLLVDRDQAIAKVGAEIEQALDIVGATAIEDKLQVRVPETIESIRKAGIKLWVLTGDKLETARNIGFSAQVLTQDMTQEALDIKDDERFSKLKDVALERELEKKLKEILDLFREKEATYSKLDNEKKKLEAAQEETADIKTRSEEKETAMEKVTSALLVTGETLQVITNDKELEALLKDIAEVCNIVMACRVSPLQKAEMVELVRTHIKLPQAVRKLETARNIGFSAKVLTQAMIQVALDIQDGEELSKCKDEAETRAKLEDMLRRTRDQFKKAAELSAHMMDAQRKSPKEEDTPMRDMSTSVGEARETALLVTGATLQVIMDNEGLKTLLKEIAVVCNIVMACRVSPLQKAQMVQLVRDNIKLKQAVRLNDQPMTLAIGDGANDVPMIQAAHVGIGIAGREGRQAVNNSDFAIGQFEYLERLLLVHGRWNYRRVCKFALFTFWRNAVQVLMIFYYTTISGYSGTSVFEDWVRLSFNFLCSLPIIAVGCFDQDVPYDKVLDQPSLYRCGREGLDLNYSKMIFTMISAVTHSLILLFVTITAFPGMELLDAGDYYTFGTAVYSCLILDMSYRVLFLAFTRNRYTYFVTAGSVALYAIYLVAYAGSIRNITNLLEPNMWHVPWHLIIWPFAMTLVAVPLLAMSVDVFMQEVFSKFDAYYGLIASIRQDVQNEIHGDVSADMEKQARRRPENLSQELNNATDKEEIAKYIVTTDLAQQTHPALDHGDYCWFGRRSRPLADYRCKLPNATTFTMLVGLFTLIAGWFINTHSMSQKQLRIHYNGEYKGVLWADPLGTDEMTEVFHVTHKCGELHKKCSFEVQWPHEDTSDIKIFYAIGPFYQNYNDYLKSEVPKELMGEKVPEALREKHCIQQTREQPDGTPIVPCGMKAVSVFNDTFNIAGVRIDDSLAAWDSDVERFANPDDYGYPGTSWLSDRYSQMIAAEGKNKGVKDRHFVEWMRPAALWRVWNQYGKLEEEVKQGQKLHIEIENNFPVGSDWVLGYKHLVLTTLGLGAAATTASATVDAARCAVAGLEPVREARRSAQAESDAAHRDREQLSSGQRQGPGLQAPRAHHDRALGWPPQRLRQLSDRGGGAVFHPRYRRLHHAQLVRAQPSQDRRCLRTACARLLTCRRRQGRRAGGQRHMAARRAQVRCGLAGSRW
eukprot:CAMPEP_0195158070 /NCGR_PEP_ID=MMETSP0448-20130528/185471_1 /TAXON_ID=66468 /ORGANISM="Heterocapsa triquestra, Strain CCMP 448" /LENGTH=1722 /DNA_ID=CAMNT_0040196865 /DNA_START=87 /DNA_END=5253 /DNA_ORIENTATION=+